MRTRVESFSRLLAGVVASAMLITAASVHAREFSGYASDGENNVIRSGFGDCVHTGYWAPADATVVGCDGVVVDATVEVLKGAPSGLVATIQIPAATLFAFDSNKLTDAGKAAIEKYRKTLRPELAEAYAGIIIGHTDSTGSSNYNLDLSKRRANSVRDYLISTGVDAGKLRIAGLGKHDPIARNDTKEGRALNRRVELIVIGEARALDLMRFPSVALFPRRSAELTDAGMKLIEKHRENAREQLSRAVVVEVVGHTDDVGDDAYNQRLSEHRAAAMKDYLVQSGVPTYRIITAGAGETMPIASNATDEGRAENRRVEVFVLGRVK